MNQDKLSKRVEFLRQEKNKSARKVSTLDPIQDVWLDGDIDASSSYATEQDSNPTITDEIILSEMMKDFNSLNEPSTFDNDDRSNSKFASGTNNVMGKKKVIPIQPVRKSSNGMVWPLQQIPMLEALRDKEKATEGRGVATKIVEDEMEDSEDEGEELLKQVKDRKQSIAKLNMSPQEKDLMKRLSTAGEEKIPSQPAKSLEEPSINNDIPTNKLLSIPTGHTRINMKQPTPHPSKIEDDLESPNDTWGRNNKGFEGNSLASLKRYASRTSLLSTITNARQKLPETITKRLSRSKSDEIKLRLFVVFLFIVCIFLVTIAHVLKNQHKAEIKLFDGVIYHEHEKYITFVDKPDKESERPLLRMSPGVSFAHEDDDHGGGHHVLKEPLSCNVASDNQKCFEWPKRAKLVFTMTHNNDQVCYNLMWEAMSDETKLMDCFSSSPKNSQDNRDVDRILNPSFEPHWYGGGEIVDGLASWPLQGLIKQAPFHSGISRNEDTSNQNFKESKDNTSRRHWGNAIRKLFYNSNGASLMIEEGSNPIIFSLNDPHHDGLCIGTSSSSKKSNSLNYTVCTSNDIKEAHDHLLPKSFWDGHSEKDLKTMQHVLKTPIWQYPENLAMSGSEVVNYVCASLKVCSNSNANNQNGYLILDHRWQRNPGNFAFDRRRFPNPAHFIKTLRDKGIIVVLTITPFVSTSSPNFVDGVEKGHFIKELTRTEDSVLHGNGNSDDQHRTIPPALTSYKEAMSVAMLDITNNDTISWLSQRLDILTSSVSSSGTSRDRQDSDLPEVAFFVDSGSFENLPAYFQMKHPLKDTDMYKDKFAQVVMKDVSVIGVNGATGIRPKAPAFVFLTPQPATWSGLKSVMANVLHVSSIGYPFVNPGPIGGLLPSTAVPHKNSLIFFPNRTDYPSTKDDEFELYVRWMQLNTFLPMMHFLKPPSDFLATHREITDRLTTNSQFIRSKLQMNIMANKAMQSSMPIIRPMWMLNPKSQLSLSIDDQFFVGDSILVAPILQKGQRKRNIYLPQSISIEGNSGNGNNEMPSRLESNNLLSSKPVKEIIENSENAQSEVIKHNASIDNIVWKQMGTAKGAGKLHKGGKWLTVEVELDEVLYFERYEVDGHIFGNIKNII